MINLINLRRLLGSMYLDIPAALRALGQIVDRIAEMIEWQKLAHQERRRPFPTSFELDDHLQDEIRDLQASFISTALDLREALGRPDLEVAEQQRRQWQYQLEQLEQRFASLTAGDRFINP